MTDQPLAFPSCTACGSEDLEPGILGGARTMGKSRWAIEAWVRGRCQHLELFARERV